MSKPATRLRPAGLAAAATGLAMTASVLSGGAASAEARYDLERVSGDNRYETSAEIATRFGQANTVILASGEPGRYADALTANYLAGLKGAPVLLTRQDKTPEVIKKAIAEAEADNVVIVGGELAVSKDQEEALQGTYQVSRIAGQNRFDTAAKVIAAGDEAQGDTALLATGLDFPDALSAGPVAFGRSMPLAITKPGDAPDNVVRQLKDAGINKVYILGSTNAVSEDVEAELKDKDIEVVGRADGGDRAETASKFAEYAVANWGYEPTVNVASGRPAGDGADALGGAALTGQAERLMLITKNASVVGEGPLTYLGKHAENVNSGLAFGGELALNQSALDQMIKKVLGNGAQNEKTGEFYDTPQAAIDEAAEGETVTVFGEGNEGFRVTTNGITVKGESGASLTSAVIVRGADNVTIADLTIQPSDVLNQLAGVYLDSVDGAVVEDIEVEGANNGVGAGVINVTGGDPEVAEIMDSEFSNLQQGVFANPSADFTITNNEFRNNAAGSANDTASVIKGNRFVNNDEGIGLGAADSTVEGNYFANNTPHVRDYTTDKGYDLEQIKQSNEFDEPVVVNDDDTAIVDES